MSLTQQTTGQSPRLQAGISDRLPLVEHLPRVLARDPFMQRYVSLCEEIWSSVVVRLDDLEWILDPATTPAEFLPWLATWLGMELDPSLPVDRQRHLVRVAGSTSRRRGTAWRLEQMLGAVTGGPARVADSGGVDSDPAGSADPHKVSVRLTTAGGIATDYLYDLIRSEVPAQSIIDLSVEADDLTPMPDADGFGPSVLVEPEPYGDEGFLPPLRGGNTQSTDLPYDEGGIPPPLG